MQTPSTNEDTKTKGKVKSNYLKKKVLLEEQGGRCAHCFRRTKVRLARQGPEYILLCHDCIIKRQGKKKRLWTRKATKRNKRKVSKTSFLAKIRKKVYERDGHKCVWCDTKEKLGLGPLIPESRGGKRSIDNFVCTCQHCRPSKGNKLPLEFIDEPIRIEEYLRESFEHSIRLDKPDCQVKIDLYMVAQLSQFLKKMITAEGVDSGIQSKAERLLIKLTE